MSNVQSCGTGARVLICRHHGNSPSPQEAKGVTKEANELPDTNN